MNSVHVLVKRLEINGGNTTLLGEDASVYQRDSGVWVTHVSGTAPTLTPMSTGGEHPQPYMHIRCEEDTVLEVKSEGSMTVVNFENPHSVTREPSFYGDVTMKLSKHKSSFDFAERQPETAEAEEA